jgi:hypothetical protein
MFQAWILSKSAKGASITIGTFKCDVLANHHISEIENISFSHSDICDLLIGIQLISTISI